MNLELLLLATASFSAFHWTSAQTVYGNCANLTLQDITDSGLVAQSVGAEVMVLAWSSYCLSSGTVRNMYRSATALVQYETRMEPSTDLFSFECNENNQWVNAMASPVSASFGRQQVTMCSFCTTNPPTNPESDYDDGTGCIFCDASCSRQELCYGDESGNQSTCCNYFHNSNCVETCPLNTIADPVSFDCMPLDLPMVPSALILDENNTLELDCGDPSLFTIHKNRVLIFPRGSVVNITRVSVADAGNYTCIAGGVIKSTTFVAVRPANSQSPLVVTATDLNPLTNDTIVNRFINMTEYTHCFSPPGHGMLEWKVEGQSTDDDTLRNELARTVTANTMRSFTIREVSYTSFYKVTFNPMVHHLYLKTVIPRRSNFTNYLICRSRESNVQQYVTVTSRSAFVDVRDFDSTPFFGEQLTLQFRVATIDPIMPVILMLNNSSPLSLVNTSNQAYQHTISALSPSDSGTYMLTVTGINLVVLNNFFVTVSPSTPSLTLVSSEPGVEGENLTIECNPSDPDVLIEWQYVDLMNGNTIPINSSSSNFSLSSLGHRLTILMLTPSHNTTFTCHVRRNPGLSRNTTVRVRRVCPPSLAAGLYWSRAIEDEIRSYRCNAIDSRFSNAVQVSRLCTNMGWTILDFSHCTLTSHSDQFILLWKNVDSISNLDQSAIISHFSTEINRLGGGVKVVSSTANITVLSRAAASVGLREVSGTSQSGQVLFRATLTNTTNNSANVSNIRINLVGTEFVVETTRFLFSASDSDIVVIIPSDSCLCMSVMDIFIFTGLGGTIPSGERMVDTSDPIPMMTIGGYPSPIRVCVGGTSSPCVCDLNVTLQCQCNKFYVGNGTICTPDVDNDGYPQQPLPLASCSTNSTSSPTSTLPTSTSPLISIPPTSSPTSPSLPTYCFSDTCPTVFNLPQSDVSSCTESRQLRCPLQQDSVFGLQWGYAQPGTTVNQPCGPNFLGNVTRVCNSNGSWAEPDASQCMGVAFVQAFEQMALLMMEVALGNPPDFDVVQSIQDNLRTLSQATAPSPNGTSAVPLDLLVTAEYLTSVVSYYNLVLEEGLTDLTASVIDNAETIIDILSNVVSVENLPGAAQLSRADPEETFASSVLKSAEEYSIFLATYIDLIMDAGVSSGLNSMLLAADNLLINPTVVDVNEQLEDVTFPPTNMFATSGVSARVVERLEEASITIPSSFLRQRAVEGGVNRARIGNVIFQNLEMFLSSTLNSVDLDPASLILSSQVNQVASSNPTGVLQNPISLSFTSMTLNANLNLACVFWDFNLNAWSTVGVSVASVTSTATNITNIQCLSNHLTSFAVLASPAGRNVDTLALNIVSYIGIGLSLVCLLATIIFFLTFGKKLLSSVHNFVHLNLAIALFLAYLVFALGIELATRNKVACHFIAALLHYLFLAVFCWMLCEGVMLYLMLVVVFSKLSKKWWFFLLLGWLPPVLFVAIGAGVVPEQYGVYDDNNNLQFCWLASGGSNFAIWFFLVPMTAIIIINSVFLVMVLVSLVRSRGSKMEMKKDGKRSDIVKDTMKASIILLPLLGVTWIIGLFAVSRNTVVFAWLFTILNTLQGVLIFVFHVLRNERIWGRIKKKYHLFESKSVPTSTSEKKHWHGNYNKKLKTDSSNYGNSFKNSEGSTQANDYQMAYLPSAVNDHSKRGESEEILLPDEIKEKDHSPTSSSSSNPIPSNEISNSPATKLQEKPLLLDEKVPDAPRKDSTIRHTLVAEEEQEKPLLHSDESTKASSSSSPSTPDNETVDSERVHDEHELPPLSDPLPANNSHQQDAMELQLNLGTLDTPPASPGLVSPGASLTIVHRGRGDGVPMTVLPSVSSPTQFASPEREDGLIFDDDDEDYPTVMLRLQTLKASSKQDYLAKSRQ